MENNVISSTITQNDIYLLAKKSSFHLPPNVHYAFELLQTKPLNWVVYNNSQSSFSLLCCSHLLQITFIPRKQTHFLEKWRKTSENEFSKEWYHVCCCMYIFMVQSILFCNDRNSTISNSSTKLYTHRIFILKRKEWDITFFGGIIWYKFDSVHTELAIIISLLLLLCCNCWELFSRFFFGRDGEKREKNEKWNDEKTQFKFNYRKFLIDRFACIRCCWSFFSSVVYIHFALQCRVWKLWLLSSECFYRY